MARGSRAFGRRACSTPALSAFASFVVVSVVGLVACGRAVEPSNKPIDTCVAACEKKAARQCSSDECERGCEFILDRLVEREQDTVLACVGRSARRCTDIVWADCAVRVGVHADGGPPAPPPPPDDFE